MASDFLHRAAGLQGIRTSQIGPKETIPMASEQEAGEIKLHQHQWEPDTGSNRPKCKVCEQDKLEWLEQERIANEQVIGNLWLDNNERYEAGRANFERVREQAQQLAQARAEIQRYDTTMAEATEELRQCKAVFERQAQWEAQARSLLERLHDAAEEPVDSDRVQDAYRALRAFLAAHPQKESSA